MSHEFEDQHHCGWIAPGQITQTVDFDFDEVDRNLAGIEAEPEDVRVQAAELLSKLFVLIWSRPDLRSALIKFSVISAGLRPDLIRRTQPEIAAEVGSSKQAVSKALDSCEKTLGIRLSRLRSATSRQHMAEAMIQSHRRRKAA